MILLAIFIILVVLNICIKNNRILGFLLLLFMFTLFGWSYGNADYSNYALRWDNLNRFGGEYEILFVRYQQVLHSMGLSYQQFLIITAAIFLFSIFIISYRNTNSWPWLIALYAIYPFSMDVVQIRNSCAIIFVYFALTEILNKEEITYKDIIKYVILIVIASMFHYMCICYLLFLIPIFAKEETNRKIALISSLIVLIAPQLIIKIALAITQNTVVENRLLVYISNGSLLDFDNIRRLVTALIIVLGSIIGQLIIQSYELPDRYDENYLYYDKRLNKINIFMLVIIPLTLIIPEIYRICTQMTFINNLYASKELEQQSFRFRPFREIVISIYYIIFALANLYWLVLGSLNINSVWYPLFYNNLFWK